MRYTLTILCFLFSILGIAQNWQYQYSVGQEEDYHSDRAVNVYVRDDGYLIRTASSPEPGTLGVGFLHLDQDGQLEDAEYITEPTEKLRSFSQLLSIEHEGFLYVCGDEVVNGNDYAYFLAKYDSELNQLWKYNYDDAWMKYPRSIVITPDNHIVIHGDGAMEDSVDITLVKVDLDGTEVWRKRLGLTQYNDDSQYGSMAVLPNGDLAIAFDCGLAITQEHCCVTLLDQDANMKWFKQFFGDLETASTSPRIIYHPNGYLQMTATLDSILEGSNVWHHRPVFLTNIDETGTILDQINLGTNKYKNVTHLSLLENGNTLLAGEVDYIDEEYDRIAIISEVDQNNNILWQRYYSPISDWLEEIPGNHSFSINDVRETEDGFIVCGFGSYFDLNEDGMIQSHLNAWVFTLDENGCYWEDECLDGQPTLMVATVGIGELDDIKMGPNPTSGELIISNLQEPLIYMVSDLEGKSISTGSITQESNVLTIESNGLYFVTLYANGKVVCTDKVLVYQ